MLSRFWLLCFCSHQDTDRSRSEANVPKVFTSRIFGVKISVAGFRRRFFVIVMIVVILFIVLIMWFTATVQVAY